MRILCIHPRNDYNIGDLMTYHGTVSLLRQAFNDVEMLQFDIKRAEQERATYIPEYNWGEDVDVILLAGSPWIGTDSNVKIDLVKQAKRRWSEAILCALGIGSFLSHSKIINWTIGDVVVDFLRDFDLIVTRDIYAHRVLNSCHISNLLYYDTAIYYAPNISGDSSSENILIYYDPFVNDVTDHFCENVWQQYINFQILWSQNNNAEIIVITSGDKESLDKKKINSRFVTDLEWLYWKMRAAKSVLSGRVHMAILAQIAGCRNVSLLPVDSRYASAVNCGVNICQPVNGLFPDVSPMPFNLKHKKHYLKTMVKWIRDAISSN